MVIKENKTAKIISLIFFSGITIFAILEQQVSIFYLIYLFWFDEFIKTISDFLTYKFYYKDRAISKIISSRFFMLSVYFVFIFVMFGLVIDWNSDAIVIGNFEVLLFKNSFFNFTIFSFFLRETALIYVHKEQSLQVRHILSNGIISLHLSIIFGIFLWAFLSGKIIDMQLNIDFNKSLAAILPFLIIKVFFEIMEIKKTP